MGQATLLFGVFGWPHFQATYFDLAQTNLTQGILRTPTVAPGNGYLNIDAPNTGVEIGSARQAGFANFDFHSSGKANDYDARILAHGYGGLAIQAKTITLAGSVKIAAPAPASSSSPCEPGQIAGDRSFVYVCAATDKWRRAALSDW